MTTTNIGNRIKELLYEKRITQTELAKKMNIHRQVLVNWLNGTRKPKIENIEKIAKSLNISIDKILNNKVIKTKMGKDKEAVYKEKLKIKEQENKLLKEKIIFLEKQIKSLKK